MRRRAWIVAGALAALAFAASGGPLTDGDRARLAALLPGHPAVLAALGSDRARVLRVIDDRAAGRRGARAVLVDYASGRAFAALVADDGAGGEVTAVQPLAGRPQPSEDEVAEAMAIVRADPGHAPMLRAGAVLVGGFLVDGPGRPVQLKVESADRRRVLRFVIVDLARRAVVDSQVRF